MRTPTPGVVCAAFALLLAACGGGGGENPNPRPPPAANVAPTANAGIAQSVNAGATVTLNGSASSDSDGTIATYAWTQTGGTPAITLSSTSIAQPTFPAPQVVSATAFTFSLVVTDDDGATSATADVAITVNPGVAGNSNVTGRITFGRVPFATVGQFPGLNYGSPVQQPARGVTVRAVAPGTTQPALATTTTNATGDYNLSVANNTNIQVLVVAEMVRTGAAPTWNVRVGDGGTLATPTYTHTDAVTFNSSAGTPHDIAIPTGINASGTATGTRASGPFAALDTIYQGIQLILSVAPASTFPDLLVDWGAQANGTFFDSDNPQRIALLSDLSADTDEFDQHVVAHEFGHYIENNFSRADNIGGAHGLGDKLDPRVAFGEGFGYAFAAIVLNDPVARDSSRQSGTLTSGVFNVETNPSTSAPGTPSGNFGCWCSESSVWSLLWDLYDSANDGSDTVSLGFGPIWTVLAGAQRTTPAYTTVFSFLTALKTGRSPAELTAMNTLVTAQNIRFGDIDAFATTETFVPMPPFVQNIDVLPLYAAIAAGGGPVVVRNVDDAGLQNALGARRFLRFTPATSGTRTVSVTTSNADVNADPEFLAQRSGTYVMVEEDPPPQPETGSASFVGGTTYVFEVYDCANGCNSAQGTPGNYNLTVTIN
jgi:hypothetical protein